MGKPRLIILIRHAQSEGNQNRSIHQHTPDHRVQLTPEGWTQAAEAGLRLKSLLKPEDTIRIYTSPYRRTRETTEGIIKSLTTDESDGKVLPRDSIRVFEEPRLREQDFGNFQPSSADMERMWKERADYGHFFYRIPNGESAADAYDRVSGFNETLWRSFEEPDFGSVCVLVTHGLMTRVFLMRWYHWSVEYFEDLRNVNHCEFVLMNQDAASGRYILQNELRTWSELQRERARRASMAGAVKPVSPVPTRKDWGGAAVASSRHAQGGDAGCGDAQQQQLPPPATEEDNEAFPKPDDVSRELSMPGGGADQHTGSTASFEQRVHFANRPRQLPDLREQGRDFGGISGAPTPAGGLSAGADYAFPSTSPPDGPGRPVRAGAPDRPTPARADTLGDQHDSAAEDDECFEAAKAEDQSVRGSVY